MFVWVLQLAYFCSLCVSLPLPQTRDSTYPPFLLNTVFPLCDGECNYFPGYRVTTQEPDDREGREDSTTASSTTTTTTNAPSTTTTTTTTTVATTTTVSTTISTTAEPQTSTVFASCDGDCPRFPEYKAKVVSDDDESDLTQSSTVFVPPVGTPTTSSVGLTSSTAKASSLEVNTPPATETTTPITETTATDATEASTTPVTETTSTPGTTVTTTPGPSPITESSTTTVAATSTTKNVSVENSTTDDTDDAVKTSEEKDATKSGTD